MIASRAMNVQPQPGPLSWQWAQVAGQIQRTPDGPPEQVTLVRLAISSVAGVFVGFFAPEDLQKLADGAHDEVLKARAGIVTALQIPGDLPRPGNSLPPGP